jgi:shikimate dehydrogenase
VHPDGQTRTCGLIGDPVSHSLSPFFHNSAYRSLGLNYCYHAFQVKKEQLPAALAAVKALGMVGLNVTAPYKQAVIPYLDHLDPAASAIHSVNTIFLKDGKLHGLSTDGEGFLWALCREGWSPEQGDAALILGAGGAASAVAYALAGTGIKQIIILNRTVGRAEQLVALLQKSHPHTAFVVRPLTVPELKQFCRQVFLLVNTLPAEPWPWPTIELLPPGITACDLRYSPPVTPFLQWAAKHGARSINGLGMLIGQAALSFACFTGHRPPFALMERHIRHRGAAKN